MFFFDVFSLVYGLPGKFWSFKHEGFRNLVGSYPFPVWNLGPKVHIFKGYSNVPHGHYYDTIGMYLFKEIKGYGMRWGDWFLRQVFEAFFKSIGCFIPAKTYPLELLQSYLIIYFLAIFRKKKTHQTLSTLGQATFLNF